MILLILVTIWIYRTFSKKAKEKDLPHVKWGMYGSMLYLVISLGGAFTFGIFWGLSDPYSGMSPAMNIVISLLFYGIGGLCSYLLYNKLKNKPGFEPDLENFGKKEEEN